VRDGATLAGLALAFVLLGAVFVLLASRFDPAPGPVDPTLMAKPSASSR
jgi:hypothetical protein